MYVYSHIHCRTSIGSCTRFIKWHHFQWPWMTPDPGFKVTILCKGKHFKIMQLQIIHLLNLQCNVPLTGCLGNSLASCCWRYNSILSDHTMSATFVWYLICRLFSCEWHLQSLTHVWCLAAVVAQTISHSLLVQL